MRFEQVIDGGVKLVTTDTGTHMNVGVLNEMTGYYEFVTINADNARDLRDKLIEAYPLPPVIAEPAADEYYVEASGGGEFNWSVMKRFQRSDEEFVAGADVKANALKIAKALNEAEGL